MSDNDDHKEQRIGLWVAGGAAGLATLAILFYAVYGWESGKIEGSPGYGQAASAAAASAASEPAAAVLAAPESQSISASVAASEPLAAAASTAAVAADAASAVVENGVVKFYFATGKADLADNAEEALKDVLAGVREGKKAVVSGYNDSTGNAAANEELSKNRALAVRNALLGFGVPESQIELRKPENTEAGQGDNAQARRVEVVLE
ncbi:MAG: OmpA family protein [Neisseria sp.]|uniref:OmpA family protein n=1 Tax=Neisseria sp. TaxID=192066 RepID=UPI0026DB7B64|nr:OmpA family protein [Neisseria sp.]MDO4247845.1 OmpA family protein [Neisseria sp.]